MFHVSSELIQDQAYWPQGRTHPILEFLVSFFLIVKSYVKQSPVQQTVQGNGTHSILNHRRNHAIAIKCYGFITSQALVKHIEKTMAGLPKTTPLRILD